MRPIVSTRFATLHVMLWGVFCACSWTWVIGMYLPRLVIERWGWWGFIAFAVPNVLGCAAFGYVVKSGTRSLAMIGRHGRAMRWFSLITIAYHMFFIVWLFDSILPLPEHQALAGLGIAVVVFGLGAVFCFLPNQDWLGLSVLVYAASLLAFANVGVEGIGLVEWSGRASAAWLGFVAPLLVFGFLVCPYLDLSFHRAVQCSPSRHSFAVFGVTFAVMIVLSVAIWFWPEFLRSGWLPGIVIAHLLSQSVFTVGVHLRELREFHGVPGGQRLVFMVLPVSGVAILYVARLVSEAAEGEIIYIAFLSLYGTVLPAWFVWRAVSSRSEK